MNSELDIPDIYKLSAAYRELFQAAKKLNIAYHACYISPSRETAIELNVAQAIYNDCRDTYKAIGGRLV